MKYYLIAGEASGDIHGSNLMKEIAKNDSNAEFRFWGGEKMASVGGTQVEHYKNTAFMGFWEVIKNLKTILSFIKICKNDILKWKPDVVILIDYPGFNMRIAKFVKEHNFKVVYYISPQVWAWKENRVKKIKLYVDKMLVILPFEKPFYEEKWNYKVDFVGHPLLDEIVLSTDYNINLNNNEKPIIAILPGSREQEINKILPEFIKMVKFYPDYHFVIAGINHLGTAFYQKFITENKNIEIIFGKTYHLLNNSYAALVASGTATLEAALFDTPMIVGYKGWKICPMICYDLRFPNLYREMVKKGAEILLIPSAFTAATGKVHWEPLLRARAIENQCYVIAAAQGGYHVNGRETWGHTMVIDYWGQTHGVLEKGSGSIMIDIDLDAQAVTRKNFPVLEHRKL